MDRIKRSWALAKASLDVLKQDKKLIIFPLISSIVMFFILCCSCSTWCSTPLSISTAPPW